MKANRKVLYEQIMERIYQEVKRSVNEMAMINSNIFSQFDEVDIFSKEYYIVSKDGRYNLVDRNGKPLSAKWFESIEQTEDGIEVKTEKGQDIVLTPEEVNHVTLSMISDIEDCRLPGFISLSNIEYISEPFELKTGKNSSVKIIAKVLYQGQKLLISSDGKLYAENGKEYVEEYESAWGSLETAQRHFNELCDVLYGCPWEVVRNEISASRSIDITFDGEKYGDGEYLDLNYKSISLTIRNHKGYACTWDPTFSWICAYDEDGKYKEYDLYTFDKAYLVQQYKKFLKQYEGLSYDEINDAIELNNIRDLGNDFSDSRDGISFVTTIYGREDNSINGNTYLKVIVHFAEDGSVDFTPFSIAPRGACETRIEGPYRKLLDV